MEYAAAMLPRSPARRSVTWLALLHVAVALGASGAPPSSPRLAALAEQVATGSATADALEAFWREVERDGAPLIEAVGGQPDEWWVTFLWRDAGDAGNVLVLGLGKSTVFTDEVMQRLAGTDVLYRTYRRGSGYRGSYQLSPRDPLTLPDLDDPDWWPQRLANFQSDPLNPRTFGPRNSFFELPGAPPQPWIEEREGTRRGEVVHHEGFASKILGNERPISVYLPPGYDGSSRRYPLFLVFDRGAYLNQVPTPTILDNLIAAGEIPPLVTVLIGNAPGARQTELPCNPEFAKFLAEELFPFVRDTYRVTTNPRQTVIGGSSFGGLASSYFALQHPELVGNVLSQSGSYWWSEGWDFRNPDPAIEGEWLTREYVRQPKREVRFYMDVGIHEAGNPSMAVVNRHFRDVLRAKGYEIVRYDEFNGGHDYVVWRGTLATGLIALMGDG